MCRPGDRCRSGNNAEVLVLASASPRRAQLLRAIGVPFESVPADVDETPHAGESPADYVRRLALEKARVVAAARGDALVLGADTTVTLDGGILGKAADEIEAREMLAHLAGHTHEVHTGVALVGPAGSTVTPPRAEMIDVATTRVSIAPMTAADLDAYVASNEWRDKAGAYAIQGRMSRHVTNLAGSYTNVVGLPVALVWDLLMRYPDGQGAARFIP
ncbi:MAG: septum formation protein Maf [Acidobacteria bacterium]|nr:septum formation protein Maf [Acidobacteriota bacterium]